MQWTHLSFFFFHNSVLQDENAGREGDLYIRSVSFNPDGKHLATGAEDKQIRVSFFFFYFVYFFFFRNAL